MSKKIYINPGHSDTDTGAVGYEVERELNVKVSNYMNEYLLAHYDCQTRMNPGTMKSLTVIANDANAWGADLLVSNHFNANGGDGFEALVYSENRRDLGEIFEKHVKAIGQNSRGVKLRPDLGILRLTDMPAVLTEGAFVDNYTDIKDWNDDAELQKLGIAYAKAAAEYLDMEEKKAPGVTDKKIDSVMEVQIWLNNNYATGLTPDGLYGSFTKAALVKALQKELGFKGADIDGVYGKKTNAAVKNLSKGDTGNLVKVLQGLLVCNKYSEAYVDGDFGRGTESAVEKYQKRMGLYVDGIAGKDTFTKLCA